MNRAAALFVLPAVMFACLNGADLCPAGFEYVSGFDYCAVIDGSVPESGPAAAATTTPGDAGSEEGERGEAGNPGEAGGGDAGASVGTGLGNTCNAATDCTGLASYCLTPLTAPASPGYCTIPNCTTAVQCTSAFACCDCAKATLAELQSYPVLCVKDETEPQVVALGCTCL